MKPKTIALMVVAGVCGLGASIMTSRILAERNNQPAPEAKVKVLRAKTRVPAFQVIKEPEKYFEQVEVAEGQFRKALSDFNDVKGQRLKLTLNEESVVTKEDLLGTDFASLSLLMEKGQRAIALRVNAESVAGGFVLPGSRVDVVSTVTRGSEPVTQTIMQDVLVLAVDGNFTKDPERNYILGTTVTLAVSPDDAQKLSLAGSLGELRLTLRALGDTERLQARATKSQDLSRPGQDNGTARTPTEEELAQAPASSPKVNLPPVKPETTPTPVVEAQPEPEAPKKTHVLTIQHGEFTHKTTFVWDDKEGSWINPASRQPDESTPPPSRPQLPKVPALPQGGTEQPKAGPEQKQGPQAAPAQQPRGPQAAPAQQPKGAN
jgi:pilus assembly protein CpaB